MNVLSSFVVGTLLSRQNTRCRPRFFLIFFVLLSLFDKTVQKRITHPKESAKRRKSVCLKYRNEVSAQGGRGSTKGGEAANENETKVLSILHHFRFTKNVLYKTRNVTLITRRGKNPHGRGCETHNTSTCLVRSGSTVRFVPEPQISSKCFVSMSSEATEKRKEKKTGKKGGKNVCIQHLQERVV